MTEKLIALEIKNVRLFAPCEPAGSAAKKSNNRSWNGAPDEPRGSADKRQLHKIELDQKGLFGQDNLGKNLGNDGWRRLLARDGVVACSTSVFVQQ